MKRVRLSGLALAFLLAGCVQEAARQATGTVVDEGLRSLNEPENRDAVRELLSSAEIEEGTRQLAAALAEGIVEGLTTAPVAEGGGLDAADALEARLQPLVANLVRDALRGAALPESQRSIDVVSARVTRAAMHEAVAQLRGELGPELRALAAELRPELERIAREDLGPALRIISEQIAAGVTTALSAQAAEATESESGRTLVGRTHDVLKRTLQLGNFLIIFVVVATVALAFWMYRRRKRRPVVVLPAATPVGRAAGDQKSAEILDAVRAVLADPETRKSLLQDLDRPPHERH